MNGETHMNSTRRLSIALALALALVASAACGRTEPSVAAADVPPRTGAVRGLVWARPFTLADPYVHRWRAEKPEVQTGWLLVLEVDPSYVEPHQEAMPVLLCGDQTVECVNFGQPSGNVVAIVPAPVDDTAMTLWFGPAELPERVDAAWIADARAHASTAELVTFTAAELAAARRRGGLPLEISDRVELDREIARLILKYSPSERELAESLLVPVLK